jgi:hypothetical protein
VRRDGQLGPGGRQWLPRGTVDDEVVPDRLALCGLRNDAVERQGHERAMGRIVVTAHQPRQLSRTGLEPVGLVRGPETRCYSAIGYLAERLPVGCQLALASRSDPPLPVGNWRAHGRLAEVRAADLALRAGPGAERHGGSNPAARTSTSSSDNVGASRASPPSTSPDVRSRISACAGRVGSAHP